MQLAQLKEDLYSDLTGLILRGVEIGTDSDIFDCIQTGRNGSESTKDDSPVLDMLKNISSFTFQAFRSQGLRRHVREHRISIHSKTGQQS